MSIKAVIFDLGNVIFKFDLSKFIKAFAEKTPDAGYKDINRIILEYSDLAAAYELGNISTRDFYKALAIETHYAGSYDEFCFIWNDIFAPPEDEMIKLLKDVSSKYELGLLSNTNEQHYNFVKTKYPEIFALFNKTYLSYEMRMRKPDDEIFREVIKRCALKPSEIFFTDDLIQNAAAAEKNGITARLFTDVSALKVALMEAGVKI